MRARTLTAALLTMTGGMIIWIAHLLVVYLINALACARGLVEAELFGLGVVQLAVGAATAVAVVIAGGMLLFAISGLGPTPSERDEAAAPHFIRWMAAAVAGFAIVAILWDGLPAAIVPPCG